MTSDWSTYRTYAVKANLNRSGWRRLAGAPVANTSCFTFFLTVRAAKRLKVLQSMMADIKDLPTEILEQVMMHLDLFSLHSAARVCRRWNSAASSSTLFRSVTIVDATIQADNHSQNLLLLARRNATRIRRLSLNVGFELTGLDSLFYALTGLQRLSIRNCTALMFEVLCLVPVQLSCFAAILIFFCI